jgi:hypothetical protein
MQYKNNKHTEDNEFVKHLESHQQIITLTLEDIYKYFE